MYIFFCCKHDTKDDVLLCPDSIKCVYFKYSCPIFLLEDRIKNTLIITNN